MLQEPSKGGPRPPDAFEIMTAAAPIIAEPDDVQVVTFGCRLNAYESEAIRARVFTKFWKHGVRGGSGLGMYIVNGLVRVHGGEVLITDSDSGGARLEIRWPSSDLRT